jgi:hypothetical protein
MTKDERIKKAIKLLNETIECLDGSTIYAPVIVELIDKWIDWNEKKIKDYEFIKLFHQVFNKEINQRIQQRNEKREQTNGLKRRILEEM